MAKLNGHLRQLSATKDAPWIGWGIIGVLLTVVAFFGVGWIKTIELKISEAERENKQVMLSMQTEKARTDALAIQVSTLLGISDRIAESLRVIDNRLTRMEVSDAQRKNPR